MKYLKMSVLVLTVFFVLPAQDKQKDNYLEVMFKGDAKIEIGGNYCGLEFHHSKPIPQRVSFYYPVANSIDFSGDYWTRDTSHIGSVTFSINEGDNLDLLDLEYTTYTTPSYVRFESKYRDIKIEVEYKFIRNYSAYVVDFSFENLSNEKTYLDVQTFLGSILRSSHSYNSFEPHDIIKLEDVNGYISEYPQKNLGNCAVYVIDRSDDVKIDRSNNKFTYNKSLEPGGRLIISQLIGCSRDDEVGSTINFLTGNLQDELNSFKKFMYESVTDGHHFGTGNDILDHSVTWAKSMLEANRHYIDKSMILMPCPAEYNFFFTHDVLLCDLAVIKYNPERVKQDLNFIVSHGSQDHVIPHAYYWKDSLYVTELAGNDNWNHFWFVIVSAAYLRHSGDKEFISEIYPFIKTSLNTVLGNKIIDGLVYSHRPDWWDVGDNTGPRSYMTILAYKALWDFIFVSTMLDKVDEDIITKVELTEQLKKNLNEKLWDSEKKYLMNYLEDGSLDEHYYMGSVLALHYGLLDDQRSDDMLASIEENILDNKIGIYNVYPMDMHTITDKLDLKSGEEGKVGYYFNGGIWTHANAFYVLGLIHSNNYQKAEDYLQKLMTVKGTMQSPRGQPAMYEYRVSAGKDYGLIDKPNFSWAAGWYLYSLYNLYGTKESTWNITLKPYLSISQKESDFSVYAYGKNIDVNVRGEGFLCSSIKYDKNNSNSLVIPENKEIRKVDIKLGTPSLPYLSEISQRLLDCSWTSEINCLSINWYNSLKEATRLTVISNKKLIRISTGDIEVNDYKVKEIQSGIYQIEANVSAENSDIKMYFKNE